VIAREKIKLEDEAINEIQVAVTHSVSGAEGSKNVLLLESCHSKHWPAKIMYPAVLLFVLFSQPEKGKSV
jgi:hypothetical protein